jgi:hypothetical protein
MVGKLNDSLNHTTRTYKYKRKTNEFRKLIRECSRRSIRIKRR